MKTLKKTLCLVLAVVMVVGVLILPAYAADDDYDDAIEALQHYGVLQGYPDGDLHKDANITRGQMAAIIYRIMTGDTKSTDAQVAVKYGSDADRFTDADVAPWAKGYIGYCTNQGVLKGYDTGAIQPNKQITGYEVMAMLLRALGYDNNNEYTGSDWKHNVLSDAALTGINKNVNDISPDKATPRGAVAQYTYDAAVKADMVAPAVWPSIGYNSLYTSLIEEDDPVEGVDDWGAVNWTTTFYFETPATPVKGTYKTEAEKLATFYGPVSQCDIADVLNETNVLLDTYTNGKGNKGAQPIVSTNTTSLVGAQGREMIIYEDRIIFKDIVLAKSKGVTAGLVDTGDHAFDSSTASTGTTVYANAGMQGIKTGPYDTLGAKIESSAYSISGTYDKDAMLIANILTGTSNAVAGGTKLKDAKVVTPTQVTIAAIRRSADQKIVGFVGTDGVTYLYDITYGHNTTEDGTEVSSGAVKVLDTTSIGKTYNVYTDGRNNVLGIEPATKDSSSYGVVIGQKPVDVDNANSLTASKAIEYTIMLADGTTSTFRSVQADGTPYSDLTSAPDLIRYLVKISKNPKANGYYTLTPATTDVTGSATTIYAGDADALGNGNVIVNDDTVFFVGNYKMTNGNQNPIAYSTNGYSIYKGFKNLPEDMAFGAGTAVYENNIPVKNHGGVAVSNLDIYALDKDGKNIDGTTAGTVAKYVLILNATEKTPIAKRAQKVANYAYVKYNGQAQSIYDTYYMFDVVLNGTASTLQVNSVSAKAVTDSGLYIYEPNSTNGYNSFTTAAPVNNITKSVNAWSYSKGVLSMTTGLTAINSVSTADAKAIGWNTQYLTVTDDVSIYIVNEETGKVVKTAYTLDQLSAYYNDIYVQVNEYGWVNLVYVVDNGYGTEKNPSTPVAIKGIKFTNSTKPTVGTYPVTGSTTMFTATVTNNPGQTPVASVKVSGWQVKDTSGWRDMKSSETFESAKTYRAVLDVTFTGAANTTYAMSATTDYEGTAEYKSATSVYSTSFSYPLPAAD